MAFPLDPTEASVDPGRRPSRREEEKEGGNEKEKDEERPSTASCSDALRNESGVGQGPDGSDWSSRVDEDEDEEEDR